MVNVYRSDFFRYKNPPNLQRVEVRQKFGAHTLVFLDYLVADSRDFLFPPENTPMFAEYGESPTGVRRTYGYVNHSEAITDRLDRALTRLVVLGTSKVMNTMTPMVWSGQSRPGIVRDITRRHRLRSVTNSHTFVQETWVSGDRTDFQCLQALAEEIGYQVWVDGATVWFLDPDQMIRSASSMTTPLIRTTKIRHVQTMTGSSIPGDIMPTKRREQYGIDSRTNQVFKATSGNPMDQVAMSVGGVDTYHEAHQAMQAQAKKQRDQQVLKGTIDGNASITPGTLVQFEAGRVNKDQGGVWMVNEANHSVSQSDFTTSLVCTRSADPVALTRLPVTLHNASANSRAVIRNGTTWEAELQERVHV